MRVMCENFNIKIHTSGAESPWQNGLCEGNHRHVDHMVEKMKEDEPNIPISKALQQAVYAKNILTNHMGYSPIQLVIGQHPKLPCAISNLPPAKEGVSMSEGVRDRLNAIFAERRSFIKTENSKKLNAALQVKHAPKMEHYEMGDMVFYKHGRSNQWHGPARVISLDNKVILIQQGQFLLSTSQSQLLKVNQGNSALQNCNED